MLSFALESRAVDDSNQTDACPSVKEKMERPRERASQALSLSLSLFGESEDGVTARETG
jgi:hypothetical protein